MIKAVEMILAYIHYFIREVGFFKPVLKIFLTLRDVIIERIIIIWYQKQ